MHGPTTDHYENAPSTPHTFAPGPARGRRLLIFLVIFWPVAGLAFLVLRAAVRAMRGSRRTALSLLPFFALADESGGGPEGTSSKSPPALRDGGYEA